MHHRLSVTVVALFCFIVLVSCGPTTKVLMVGGSGSVGPALSPSDVIVYQNEADIECPFERVALVESQASRGMPFSGGVFRIDLIRAAREKAAKIGANALFVQNLGLDSYMETKVSADSTGYERRDSRESWGHGMFLALSEKRPCDGAARENTDAF